MPVDDPRDFRLEGVDMSLNDLSLFSSVRVAWTTVTDEMTKPGKRAFIGIKERLSPGEIIQTGMLKTKYKIVNCEKTAESGWFLYCIKRVDGNPIGAIDITNSKAGDKVRITNRRTFKQLMNF